MRRLIKKMIVKTSFAIILTKINITNTRIPIVTAVPATQWVPIKTSHGNKYLLLF